jgi:hypothetical protein
MINLCITATSNTCFMPLQDLYFPASVVRLWSQSKTNYVFLTYFSVSCFYFRSDIWVTKPCCHSTMVVPLHQIWLTYKLLYSSLYDNNNNTILGYLTLIQAIVQILYQYLTEFSCLAVLRTCVHVESTAIFSLCEENLVCNISKLCIL